MSLISQLLVALVAAVLLWVGIRFIIRRGVRGDDARRPPVNPYAHPTPPAPPPVPPLPRTPPKEPRA